MSQSPWDSRTIAFSALGDLLSVGESPTSRSQHQLTQHFDQARYADEQARCANERELANFLHEMQFRISRVEAALSKVAQTVEQTSSRPAEGHSESQLSELKAQIKSEVLKDLSSELRTNLESSQARTPDPVDEETTKIATPDNATPDPLEKPNRWRRRSGIECLIVDANWEYEFESSIWDSLIFIGVGRQSVLDVAIHVAITLLFFLIQSSMLSVLAGGGFSSNPFDGFTQSRLKFWRATEGHSIYHVNEFDSSSLVSRVCSDDPALSLATNQQALYQDIAAYFTPAYLSFVETGRMVFFCCVLIYIIQIAVDIQEAFHKLLTVLGLPWAWGYHTSLSWEDDACKLVHLSGGRRILEIISFGARAVFDALLLYYGADWLLYTTDVPSLLLNTTALNFLLGVDSDMFGMGAPMILRVIMNSVEPLPSPAFPGRQLLPLFYLIVVVAVALGFGIRGEHVMNEMQTTSDILCANNLQFAASMSKLLGVHWASTTEYDPDTKMSEWADGRYFAIRALIEDYDKHKMYTENVGTVNLLAAWTSGTMEFLVDQAETCVDMSNVHVGGLVYVVSNNDSMKVHSQCADFKVFCASTAEWARKLRAICPGTCECLEPDSGLVFLGTPVNGCNKPEQHTYACNLNQVKQKLHDQPCKDTDLNKLQSTPAWNTALQVILASKSEFDHDVTLVSEVHSNLTKYGCAGLGKLSSDTRLTLCQARNIPFWCPEACTCPQKVTSDCPCTCHGAHRSVILCS